MDRMDCSRMLESMEMPKFLNTPAKWYSVVEYIDNENKLNEIALKILDDDQINVIDFINVMVKLGEDLKYRRSDNRKLILVVMENLLELMDFVMDMMNEEFINLRNRIMEFDRLM